MTPVYFLNIAVSVLLLFWPLWFARTQLRLPWINPFSIVLMVAAPVELMRLFIGPLFLIEGGLFDTGYQYALLMANLLAMAQAAGALTFFRFSRRRLALEHAISICLFRGGLPWAKGCASGSGFFLLIFLLALFALANADYGVVNWLLNPRMGYQFYRTGQGHWYHVAGHLGDGLIVLCRVVRKWCWRHDGRPMQLTHFHT